MKTYDWKNIGATITIPKEDFIAAWGEKAFKELKTKSKEEINHKLKSLSYNTIRKMFRVEKRGNKNVDITKAI